MGMAVPLSCSRETLISLAQLTGQVIMRTGARPLTCLTSLQPKGVESGHHRLGPVGDLVAVDQHPEAPGPTRYAFAATPAPWFP
jgi:hypothetical protein